MANSVHEIKEILGIDSFHVLWNDPFPSRDVVLSSLKDDNLHDKVQRFYSLLDKHGMSKSFVNRKDLYKICQVAESCDVTIAYIVSAPLSIELFFCHKMETSDWLSQFKPLCTRRQFFTLVHTIKNIKPVDDCPISQYYQMVSPNLPMGYSVNVGKIGKDYILVSYRHDVAVPFFRVIKVTSDGFDTFIPEVHCNLGLFDSIELCFDGKSFRGDSLKTLWDGTETESKEVISVEYDGVEYELNTSEGTVFVDNEIFDFPKFRKGKNIEVILSVNRRDKKALLLSNGFLWMLQGNTCSLLDIRSFSGFETVNMDLFSMSSSEKGIVISKDANSLELVPCSIFSNIIYRLL